MARPRPAPITLAGEQPAEGRLFCPRQGCTSGFAAWVTCSHPDCPPRAELVERPPAKEGRHG